MTRSARCAAVAVIGLLGAGTPAATGATTRVCGTIAKDGYSMRALATGTSCARARSVARRYDIRKDSQTLLGYRCTFERRGLVRCRKGGARLRYDLRAVE